jgi:hypothetical protein
MMDDLASEPIIRGDALGAGAFLSRRSRAAKLFARLHWDIV